MAKHKWLAVWQRPQIPGGLLQLTAGYLEWLQIKNYTIRSLETIRCRLSCFLTWCFDRGLDRPEQITRELVQQYHQYLEQLLTWRNQPLTLRGRNRYLGAVTQLCHWLAQQGHLLYDPAADITLPRVGQRLPRRVLSYQQIEHIFSQIDLRQPDGLRDRAILETLYSCGLRASELIGLALSDVNLSAGSLLVR